MWAGDPRNDMWPAKPRTGEDVRIYRGGLSFRSGGADAIPALAVAEREKNATEATIYT